MDLRTKQVIQFMVASGQPVLEIPTIPLNRVNLRIKLLQEELDELKEGINNNDLVEVFDALLDLEYILLGTVVEFGMAKIFDEGFEEVHSSNMSKFCKDGHEVIETMISYKNQGVNTHCETMGDLLVIKRIEDGKILKNINYRKCNLQPIIYGK
jgi:hypothetical protein